MLPLDFLLASSLKTFLVFDAAAEVQLRGNKPLQEFIDADELKEHWVRIALIKWEMHHGFNLDLDTAMEYSIDQLVQHAQDTLFLLPEDYMDHVLKRHEEIENIFIEHQWDDSEFDEEQFNRDEYLRNKN